MANPAGSMYGPILIGQFFNSILYGATVIQALIYFQTFKSDTRWMKMFVLYLLCCETLNTAFTFGLVYEPLIIRNGTVQVLTNAPTMIPACPMTTVMISLPVQLFIAWRVRVMSGSSILPVIISFLAIVSFVGGALTTILVSLIDLEYALFHKNGRDSAVGTWLAASAVTDIIITASLVHSLLQKRTGFAATDDIINRIIRLTVQTGLITAVAATIDVTLYLAFKSRTWNFISDLALPKLYANTLLSTLNARGGWRASSTVQDNVLFGNRAGGECTAKPLTQVEVVTTVTTNFDPRRNSGKVPVPMQVFDSGDGHVHDDSSSAFIVNSEVAKAV